MKYVAILLIMLGGCNADYHSKTWADRNLKNKPTITIVNHFLELGFVQNKGMIFGILNGKMPQFAGTVAAIIRGSILLALTLFIVINRTKSLFSLLPFLFFWVGAVGNLIDSLIYGYVIDFIHIQAGNIFNWPFFFNVADFFITTGILLLMIRCDIFIFGHQRYRMVNTPPQ